LQSVVNAANEAGEAVKDKSRIITGDVMKQSILQELTASVLVFMMVFCVSGCTESGKEVTAGSPIETSRANLLFL